MCVLSFFFVMCRFEMECMLRWNGLLVLARRVSRFFSAFSATVKSRNIM